MIIFWHQLRICVDVPPSAPAKRAQQHQQHNLENPIIPTTIIGLFNPPWFLPNFGPKLDFLLGSSKRLHGRLDPSRHPPAITLHPVLHPAGPARDTETKSHRKSGQDSRSAEGSSPCRCLQDHSVFVEREGEGRGGNKKPQSLVTQSSEPSSSRQSSVFAAGDILPFQFS